MFKFKRMVGHLLCLGVCLAGMLLFAQESPPQRDSPGRNVDPKLELPAANSTTNSNSHSESIEVLKAQRDLMEKYDAKILSTVYWSLGGLAAVVLVVITLGWWTNFRVYKADLNEMREELKKELRVETDKIKAAMTLSAKSAGESAVKSAIEDIRLLQLEHQKVEAEKYEKAGYLANALLCYSRAIPIANGLHSDLYVPDILEQMIALLKRKGFAGHSIAIASVAKSLDCLSEDFAIDVAAIKELLAESRTRKETA